MKIPRTHPSDEHLPINSTIPEAIEVTRPATHLATVPDLAAEELLAPLEACATATSAPPSDLPDLPGLTFEQALADGTIPTFDEQPADKTMPGNPPALDPEAERAAYLALLQLIAKDKDPGTTVTALDPDSFMRGLI